MDPAEWAAMKAEQTAEYEADRQARIEASARAHPVTDAEMAAAAEQPRKIPAINPDEAARWKTGQTADVEAGRQARAIADEGMTPQPRDYPAPDPAEVARWRQEQAEHNALARERVLEPETGQETPPIDPAEAAAWKATQTADAEADRHARREAAARLTPVTDAELARYGAEAQPEAEADQAQPDVWTEIHEEIEALSAKVDELDALDALDAERAERRAEMTQAAIDEPVVRRPQAEAELESSWQPGDVRGHYEAQAGQDTEPEMELRRLTEARSPADRASVITSRRWVLVLVADHSSA
jgi:hypothetical protein